MTTPRRPFSAERHFHGAARTSAPGAGQGADTQAILTAIEGLSGRMAALEAQLGGAAPAPAPEPVETPAEVQAQLDEARLLRTEIIALARSIEETKTEIAKLRDQRPEGDRLSVMAHEMDAIVGATENATNGILDAVEAVTNLVGEIQAQEKESYIRQIADDIQDKLMAVYEHCNFQDLTGQRITKVVNTMKFIEERIDRMMDIWGRDQFLAEDKGDSEPAPAHDDDPDRRLLNGPQQVGKGISQNEIDALFD
jgi:chemotaxis protein CheZ